MENLLFTLAALFVPSLLLAQITIDNYVKNTIFQIQTSGNVLLTEKIEGTTYYDGLGRPNQSVSTSSGSQSEDMLESVSYQAFGRQVKYFFSFSKAKRGVLMESGLGSDFNSRIRIENIFYSTRYSHQWDLGYIPNVLFKKSRSQL